MRVATWVVACMSLLALGGGFQRALVLCSGAHCESRIELAHAPGSCCPDHRGDHGSMLDGDDPSCAEDGGCTDVALPLEIGPLPKPSSVDLDPQPGVEPAVCDDERDQTPVAADLHPLATGPPRTDRRTALRASVLLLI